MASRHQCADAAPVATNGSNEGSLACGWHWQPVSAWLHIVTQRLTWRQCWQSLQLFSSQQQPSFSCGNMEPRGTKTWIVDASACGQKGLTWRTNLGGAKFVTRPGGDEGKGQGFVPNGSRVRGVEEYRGWVKCSNGLWLPVTDAAGAAGDKASTEALPVVTKQRPTPVGRSGLGRDSTGKCIPYLHVEGECNCGGAWCSPTAQLLPEPAPAKFEYTWPAAPQKPATVVKPKPWWTWHHVAVGAVVAVLVLVLASQEESPEASYARRLRVPPLYRALEPFFRG